MASARANPAIIGPSGATINEAVNSLLKSARTVASALEDPVRQAQLTASAKTVAGAQAKFSETANKVTYTTLYLFISPCFLLIL